MKLTRPSSAKGAAAEKKAAQKKAALQQKTPSAKKPARPATPLALTGRQRRYLRSLAHEFKPVVQIGRGGLTEAVVAAVDIAISQHELIKVKLSTDAALDSDSIVSELSRQTGSSVAQVIGHTVLLYRRHAEKPAIVLPKAKPNET